MRQTRSARTWGLASAVVVLSLCGIGLIAMATVPAAAGTSVGYATRVLNVRDEGHLHFVRASGSLLIDEGKASGTFPGSVTVRFLYNGEPTVSARFTISGSGGSISGRGMGRFSSPTSRTPSFRGRMSVTGGTGRYAHVHGGGEMFGVFNRRSYGLTVQAVGKLPY